jgi:superfamily II DNA or RNA helicase
MTDSTFAAVADYFPPEVEHRGYQLDAVNQLGPLDRVGIYAEVGTGKTFMATVIALIKKRQKRNLSIVLMPPILIKQWKRWLDSLNNGVTSIMYKGTPKQRAKMDLNVDFALMSIQVFKKDYARLIEQYEHLNVTLIVDEAACIKNPGSQNYRCVRDFSQGRDLVLMDGTPLSTPADAYAYIKLVSPQVYRNQSHFNALHVAERDFFDNVTKWCNLDFLAENMMLNSVRILKEEALPYLKKPQYTPMHYDLSDEHYALYKKLMDQQLLLLPNGGKIDATTAGKLRACAQQIVCNPGHFSGDPNMRSAAHELLDTVLDELAADNIEKGKKLIVFAYFKMTNRGLVQYLEKTYGAVACYSEVSQAQQIRNLERFKTDPTCRVLILQPGSAGRGVDGLQDVCSDALFLETPSATQFKQGVGRLDRDGQKVSPNIRIAIADGTIQPRLFRGLLAKDELVNMVQGGWEDLRESIYGKE